MLTTTRYVCVQHEGQWLGALPVRLIPGSAFADACCRPGTCQALTPLHCLIVPCELEEEEWR